MYLFILAFVSLANTGEAQTDSTQLFFDELKEELFPQSQKMIHLYEYLGDNCSGNKIDSTIMIREDQPDPFKAVYLLKRIEYSKNGNYFEPLLDVYQKHLDNYLKEFYELYKDPKYKGYNSCEPISFQYEVIEALEEALKSLYLNYSKFSTKEIFDFYINEKLLQTRAAYQQKPELYKDYKLFYADFFKLHDPFNSKYLVLNKFDDINKNRIDPYDGYIYPYYDELKPFFVAYLVNLNCSKKSKNNISKDSCNCLRYIFNNITPINDERIYVYYFHNFNVFLDNGLESLIYLYAGEHYNVDFSNFVADKLILHSLSWEPYTISRFFEVFIKDDRNENILIDKIIQLAETDYEKALMYFTALKTVPINNIKEKTLRKIELINKLMKDSKID